MKTNRLGSGNALCGLTVTVLTMAGMTTAVNAQGRLSPAVPMIDLGPDHTGVTVYSNASDKVGYSWEFQFGGPASRYGDDLHMLRAGMLTSFEFGYREGTPVSATVRFYQNDESNGGRLAGDQGPRLPAEDLIASFVVEGLPSALGADSFYRVRVNVDPPVYLPKDVWMTVAFQNVTFMELPLGRAPVIGTSDSLSYLDLWGPSAARFEDFGDLNHCFEVRMAPSPADTQVGMNVTVDPEPNVTITYDNVTQAGATQVTTSSTNPFPDANIDFLGVYYEIETNALFNGQAEICLPYDDTGLAIDQELALQLLHWNGTLWEDITSSIDTVNNVICGVTSSFSPFAIGHRVPLPIQGMIDDLVAEVTLANLRHGIANSLDAKLDAARAALGDYNEINNGAAINALNAFINQVQAQRGGAIDEVEADVLIQMANEIIASI